MRRTSQTVLVTAATAALLALGGYAAQAEVGDGGLLNPGAITGKLKACNSPLHPISSALPIAPGGEVSTCEVPPGYVG